MTVFLRFLKFFLDLIRSPYWSVGQMDWQAVRHYV